MDLINKMGEYMLNEEIMEDAIAKNPERYIEKDLKLLKRQLIIGSYRFDLLFEDRHGAKLIVEIQQGTLDRNHTYKILDYYDEYKDRHKDEFVEVMIIANKIPRERRDRLKSNGISFREINESDFPNKPVVKDKLKLSNRQTTFNFKHHRNISDNWDPKAYEKIEKWLKLHINTLPIGEHIKVNETCRSSRSIGNILSGGNSDGIRHLLWELHCEEYIEFPDNLHYVVLKRIE